jgi:hypothetical protein
MLVALTSDHDKEAREELADTRIRLAWALEEDPEGRMRDRRFAALRHVLLAYDLLRPEDD